MKRLVLSLFILLTVSLTAFSQTRTVTGTVRGDDGQPIPGASVKVKEAPSVGMATGIDGKFSLVVPANGRTLTIAFLGYVTQEIGIPANNVANVTLASDATSLDAVVITAGGVAIKRREQGNQATTVNAEVLTQAKAFNVASALTGKVAGLQVNAVSSGVNPNVRLVLRGNRSLLGNNQALVVVDNVIVPNNILGNLNPEDIENVEVLNGAGAASLYGSDASNGALIITTKTGKRGVTSITASHTVNLDQVSFYPQLQKEFGSGTTPDDIPTYTAYENQQYGPRFDGSMRVIGKPLVNGAIQTIQYSPTDEKEEFWETGISNQSDFSMSSGDDKGSYYLAGQYFDVAGTVPGDKYNRFTLRINGKKDLTNNFAFTFNTNYIQNRYNTSSATAATYDNVLQTPAHIPLTRYKNWKTDEFSNPSGYFNEYYANPYFSLANNRATTRNDYLTGNVQVKWFPIKELSALFRVSLNTQNASNKNYTNKFTYSDYRLGITGNFANILGSVSDGSSYSTQINPEFQAQYIKRVSKDFSLNVILGASMRSNISKGVSVSASNLVQPDLFNISNSLNNPSAGEDNVQVRQLGIYGDARIGFKDYLYLHVTGRNDWRSVLSAANRSFFYPSADISFIASEAIPFLKNSKVVNSLKFRGGVSRVGLVNIGAYSLVPTFGQQSGFPYSGVAGFGLGGRIVSPNLNPEITESIEGGIDFELYQSRITGGVTYYTSRTTDQTVPINIPTTTGFTSYLTNTGEVSNKGLETSLRFVPVRTASGFELTVGANYTYNDNQVVSISTDLPQLNLASSGNAQVVAMPGKAFPMLKGTTYNRDPQGRIIVNAVTGLPSVTTLTSEFGNTEPKHRLGADLTAAWKGFRLAGLFEYRGSFVMYNAAGSFDFSGSGIRTTYFNRERFVVPNSSYSTDGGVTYVANTSLTTNTGGADFWTNGPVNTGVNENYLYSAAFWKLRELSLSYDIPKTFLGSLKYIKGARISLQGRNLFLWTPKTNIYTDPEYSAAGSGSNAIGLTTLGQTPPVRSYGATLSLTF